MQGKSAPTEHARLAAVPAVAVVVSRYNGTVTGGMLDGARRAYAARGGGGGGVEAGLTVIDAPGAFELPVLAMAAARTGRFRGVVALGCIIKGETSHDRYLAEAVAQGLVRVGLDTGVPIGFGVLTVDTPAQAEARSGGAAGNKGEEAMHAVLDTIAAAAGLRGMEPRERKATGGTPARRTGGAATRAGVQRRGR